MRPIALLLALSLLAACSSNSEKPMTNGSNPEDSLTADLNTLVTHTLFDSIPVEKLPYTDSICISNSKPLRQIKLSPSQIAFLKLRDIREFSEYYWPQPDSAFSLVCRLPLSKDFYSIIFNYEGQNESMNFLIQYDREFRVIDYLEVSYDEWVESAQRTTATIDQGKLSLLISNFMNEEASRHIYNYSISDEGFFREIPGQATASSK